MAIEIDLVLAERCGVRLAIVVDEFGGDVTDEAVADATDAHRAHGIHIGIW